ncbi:MAG: hypothetical protein ACYCO0_04165, partial [Candidatus Micrarchaeaceae archaeon]
FIRKNYGKIFDETFISGFEDFDLSLKLSLDKINYSILNFRIDSLGAGTLGKGKQRYCRDIANHIYFSYKVEKHPL